ncbi:MAG: polysulfide reductase NrfD [Planctomycetes bacterium]|nr:polysulfide reductase NrfD [Planctomycetota bacterium]
MKVARPPAPLPRADLAPPPVATGALPAAPGYQGQPVVKPPVWTWQVPTYLFVGGVAGMSGPLALGALLARPARRDLARVAAWTAAGGALASAGLLTWDLGRPRRFLNMLRVFKPRSPMSVGSWVLTAYGGAATGLVPAVEAAPAARRLQVAAAALAAPLGAVTATYTGVLIGATAVPVWARHSAALPAQFGASALGAAAAVPLLLGLDAPPLRRLLVASAGAEVATALHAERRADPVIDRPLREGASGLAHRAASLLSAGAAGAALLGRPRAAAAAFLVGSLALRWGWILAGRASARDPAAALRQAR